MNRGLDLADAEASAPASSQSSQDRTHAHAHLHHRRTASADHDDNALLGDDPLQDPLDAPITFKKRKPKKRGLLAQGSRLLASLAGSSSSSSSSSSPPPPPPPPLSATADPDDLQPSPRSAANKDGAPLDWYAEGPGRRVGYEDLTAIDWIFEYTKERTRLRVLRSNSQGLLGKLQLSFDAAQEWIILVATGAMVGTLAAVIDITTDWLGDLKAGYCTDEDGGAFYLNRAFCCLGYNEEAQCLGWRPWAKALHVSSTAGGYIVEWFFFLLFSLLFASCASILVQEFAMHAKHSGIPEIKTVLGGFIIKKFLGVWTLITKSFGLCLAVASGMWLGKEGPLVHVACCCANLFIKLFPIIDQNEARKREVLSAAAASGISVAFGSPIGGVLFSLEQISYYFPDKTMWKSFVCASVAAVVLRAYDPFRTGQTALYHVKYDTEWHGFEIVPFIIMGIMGGIYGGLFIKLNIRIAEWKKTKKWLPGPITQVIAVAFFTAIVSYPNLYMRAQSSELVANLFAECARLYDDPFGLCTTGAATAATITKLLYAAFAGFFLASITFGLQIPAGIILPSMAIGALCGRAVGIVMEIWVHTHPAFYPFAAYCAPDVPCINPGTYAIIGAAAALAGATRMTVSIVVIMFELTGALTYVLPIMTAVMFSKWVGDSFGRRGIYESWIHFRGYPFLDNSDGGPLAQLADIPAAQVMTRAADLVVLPAAGHTIASLAALLAAHPHRGFPVVAAAPAAPLLLGYISRAELAYSLRAAAQTLPAATTPALFTAPPPARAPAADDADGPRRRQAAPTAPTLDLRPWMDQTPLTLPSRSSVHLAISYFQKLGLRYVLFSDRGVLQGLLTKKDVWLVLNGAEETRRSAGTPGNLLGVQTGITREDGVGEERGLLNGRDEDAADDDPSPGVDVDSFL